MVVTLFKRPYSLWMHVRQLMSAGVFYNTLGKSWECVIFWYKQIYVWGTSLVVQWLRSTFQCRGLKFYPCRGTMIPQASGQLNLLVLTTEPEFPNKDPSQPKRKKYIFGLFPTFLAQNFMNPLTFSWVTERNVFCYSLQTPFNYTWVYANEVTQWFTG